ncbi:hypothetical protein TNCV_6491 [Trichonephila clavipes]|nr:hypothetical protein TNCV_6491 [Trichonephila clavipes]
MSSSFVPLKTRRVGERYTLNLSKLKRPPVGVEVRRGEYPFSSELRDFNQLPINYGSITLRPVPLKTRRVGQRCTLNLSRAETSSRWCGVVVRRGVCASSGVVHVT